MSQDPMEFSVPHDRVNGQISVSLDDDRSRVIANLLGDALARLEYDQDFARQRIQQAVALAGGGEAPMLNSGGLAPWQKMKATEFVAAHIGAPMRIERAAAAVRLSPNYFSRAFKASFGKSFSHYVIGQRIMLAKELLRRTEEPLCQIALACGLADQAHLSRMFRSAVGVPPAAWRRLTNDGSYCETGT